MLESLARVTGDFLDLDSYNEDFDHHFDALRDADVWKLERLQDFHQPENPSWMRYLDGEVRESLRMLEDDRDGLLEAFGELRHVGCRVLRVRVVSWPITPYLFWELHSLNIRAQCGENIRVISPDAVVGLEEQGLLPEVVTLGDRVTYRIRYDDRGVLDGSVRYLDPEVTGRCAEQIADLYAKAEPIGTFFPREVSPLEAPRV